MERKMAVLKWQAGGVTGRSVPNKLDTLLQPPDGCLFGRTAQRSSQHHPSTSALLAISPQLGPAPCPSLGALFELDLGPQARQSEAGGMVKRRSLTSLSGADRSLSDLESYRVERAACQTSSEEDQLLQLCCPTNDIELAVAEHLRHVRGLPLAMRGDIEELAQELLAMGLLVQVRQGTGSSESSTARAGRDCLRSLRHSFMVCTGYQRGGEPTLFREPLVVEPRFKEQFVIAHPTPAYAQLLQVLPLSFVGSAHRLEAAVRLLADQIALAFRQAGRSLPPWRTAEAIMSKWAPAQLSELTKLLATTASVHPNGVATAAQQQVSGRAVAGGAGPVVCVGTPVMGLQRLATGPGGRRAVAAAGTPPRLQPGVSEGGDAAGEHSAALELVRSMSRQMSSTGMCAHSVPETQAAFMRADSLRRSLCGVNPGAAGGGHAPLFSPDRPRNSPGLLVAPGELPPTMPTAPALGNAANGSGFVTGAGAGVGKAGGTKTKSPFLNAVQANGRVPVPSPPGPAAPAIVAGPVDAAVYVAAAGSGRPPLLPLPTDGSFTPLPHLSGASGRGGSGDGTGAATGGTLRIVRQSSSDLKQAVKQARGRTHSALAAALKAVAAAPAAVGQAAAELLQPRGQQQQQGSSQPALGHGGTGGGPGPPLGARLGVRRVGPDDNAWPPRITTVKWGAQGR